MMARPRACAVYATLFWKTGAMVDFAEVDSLAAGYHQRGGQPLHLGISPHKLRHTFASVLIAIGRDPISVMAQLGHTDPAFTLRVYAHMMRRSDKERDRLRTLVGERVAEREKTQTSHKTPISRQKRPGRGSS